MPRLGNPIVYDLLTVAEELAGQKGRTNLRKAAMRRAISTAYYAVFHALAFVCADELVAWSKGELHEPIYRSLDHRMTKERLTGKSAKKIGSAILDLGSAFALLQEERHAADYAPPSLKVSPQRTAEIVTLSRQAIELIEGLGKPQRLELAILLIAKARPH